MRLSVFTNFLLLFILNGPALCADAPQNQGIEWQQWSPAVFEKAKAGRQFVLLDLHAVWCHWCHVMDEQTYRNPKVIELIRSKFIAVGVDQDSRPDLANRYEDYGWPATVVFAADGTEIVKRRGFIPPGEMVSLLEAIIKDPTPGPSVTREPPIQYSADTALSQSLRAELRDNMINGYDTKNGSWGATQKFLDWDNVEYCLTGADHGNDGPENMAKQTLSAQRKLLDPVWGGVYQYSTNGDWEHPHFEKLIQFQAENMRIYAQAFALWGDPAHLAAAEQIHRYVFRFLTGPAGAFYTSQDADLIDGTHAGDYFKRDDKGRRSLGIPRVDTRIYARENGWMIQALSEMYAATGEKEYLSEAVRAANEIIKTRSLPDGGWRHDAGSEAGPFLGDSLFMGRAFLSLYAVTGTREWLQRAVESAKYIATHFVPGQKNPAGVFTTTPTGETASSVRAEWDENVAVARFANLLFYYTDAPEYRALAQAAMRYLATPAVARSRHAFVGGLLLADQEMSSAPLHIVVVGGKADAAAQKLFEAAVRYPVIYKQVEWQDNREPPLHADASYPGLPQSAAFICTDNRCSLPVLKPEGLAAEADRLRRNSGQR